MTGICTSVLSSNEKTLPDTGARDQQQPELRQKDQNRGIWLLLCPACMKRPCSASSVPRRSACSAVPLMAAGAGARRMQVGFRRCAFLLLAACCLRILDSVVPRFRLCTAGKSRGAVGKAPGLPGDSDALPRGNQL